MAFKMLPTDWRWSPEFEPEEFEDPYGEKDTGYFMAPEFMDKLHEFRMRLNSEVIINPNGGFSSQGHAHNSPHLIGMAADFHVPGVGVDTVSRHIRNTKFRGVGFYEHWKPISGFHVDMMERRARWVRTGGGITVSLT